MEIAKHFSYFFSEQLIAFVSEERSRGVVYPPGTYIFLLWYSTSPVRVQETRF